MPLKLLTLIVALAFTLAAAAPAAAEFVTVKLSPPDFSAPGPTVLQALRDRKSERAYAAADLSLEQLSEVLWAAGGVNRPAPAGGKAGRTAPSARNVQGLEIYALTKEGVYHYDHQAHELRPVTAGDHRAAAGPQAYVASAPLNLVYVADLPKFPGGDETKRLQAALTDVGFMAENVYLYCAAAGLNVVARTSVDPAALAPLLKLDKNFLPLMGQTVGLKP